MYINTYMNDFIYIDDLCKTLCINYNQVLKLVKKGIPFEFEIIRTKMKKYKFILKDVLQYLHDNNIPFILYEDMPKKFRNRNDVFEFIQNNNLEFSQNGYRFIVKYNLKHLFTNIDLIRTYETIKNVTLYIFKSCIPDSIKYCKVCKNPSKIKGSCNVYPTCGNLQCSYKLSSLRMTGKNNSFFKLTEEQISASRVKQSITMKNLILNGKFTPPISNSWANSRTRLSIDNSQYTFRSTWECLFYLLNSNLKYEHTRILYKFRNIEKNYITDFTDESNKIIYEIKPNNCKNIPKNVKKFKYAKEWCKKNSYTFVVINEDYFYSHINDIKKLRISGKDVDKMNRSIHRIQHEINKKNSNTKTRNSL